MSDDERIECLLSELLSQHRAGQPAPLDAVLLANPDLAVALDARWRVMEMLDRLAAGAPAPAPSGCEAPRSPGDASRPGAVAGLSPASLAPRVNRIGDFRIVREIGRGGMGVVYEAEQLSMHRLVALKVLYPSVTTGPKAIARFQREARATGRLHHTNIVQVYAMGEDAGQWYYGMELVRGRALSDVLGDLRRLRGGTATPDDQPTSSTLAISTTGGSRAEYARIAEKFAGLADALATAHEGGVVHRDVKPSNVMLDETGRLKILDFGLAAVQHEAGNVTAPGDVLGTPAYMSPEQARARPAGPASDIYSLGATLYEVLTLRPAVRGRDFADTVRRILATDPVPPRRLQARIPRDLETIVLKTLEKEPARRYATAGELARDLRAFADDHAIAARRVGPLGRAWRQARRHPARTLLLFAALSAVVFAASFASIASQAKRGLRAEEARRLEREYRDLLSRALVEGGDSEEGPRPSVDLFTQAITLAPDRHDAYYLRAIHRARWDGTGTENLIDLEAARARGLPERHYRLARTLVLHEHARPVEAAAEAASSVDASPPDIEVVMLLAAIAAARKQDAEAERLFDEVIGAAARGSHVLLRAYGGRSDVRTRMKRFAAAIEDRMAQRALMAPDFVLPTSDVKLAWLWRRLGSEAEAERHVEQAFSDYEGSGTALSYSEFGGQAYRLGEVAWARRAVEAGLRQWPEDVQLRADRLRWLPAVERIPEADRILAELTTTGAGGVLRRHFVIASKSRALEEQGNLEEALAVIDEVARRSDASPPTRQHRANLLRRLGRFAEAEIEWRAGLGTQPWPEAMVVGYAGFLLQRRRLEEARELLEAAVRTDSSQFPVLDLLVSARQRLGDAEGAAAAAREALALAGDVTAAGSDEWFMFPVNSLTALASSHPAEVVDRLKSLCRASPREPFFRARLAQALLGLGRAAEAWDVLESPPPLEAGWELDRTRADVLLALERYAEASRAAEALIQAFPQEPDGYFTKLLAQGRLGPTDGLIPLAQAFLDAVAAQRAPPGALMGTERVSRSYTLFSDAQLSWAHYMLGFAHMANGHAAQADVELEKALERWPPQDETRVAMLRERAWALAMLRRHDEASKAIEEAARLRPDDPAVALYRSNISVSAGDFENYERWIREAIRLSGPGGAPLGYHLQLTTALLYVGRLQEAIAEADASLARGLAEAATYAALARSLDPHGDAEQLQRARELAEHSVSGPDATWAALRAKGAVHVAAGEWREAVAALEASVAQLHTGRDFLTSILLLRAQCRLGAVKDPAAALAALRADPEWRYNASPLVLRLAEELAREFGAAAEPARLR